MITRENFEEVVLSLNEEDKQRILDSDKEYCVLYLSVFNVGSVSCCKLTNDFTRYQYVSNNGNAILELSEIASIIEVDNESRKVERNIEENIAKLFQHLSGKQNRKAIFKHFRNTDESHLYPFVNAADKAIRNLYVFERKSESYLLGLELCYFLTNQISKIVNTA